MTISGAENHQWLVSASDFWGESDRFSEALENFLSEALTRTPLYQEHIRLGYMGVPPIVSDLYDTVEQQGGIVVYNEVQQQFALCDTVDDISEQYVRYTYPYGMQHRLPVIVQECKKRQLQGLIHYVQSFCAHSVDDIMLREALDIPIVTIECDRPGTVSEKNKIKLEAFLERWVLYGGKKTKAR